MKPKQHIDFYFDFISPWAYFAWQQMKELKAKGVTLDLRPVPYPQLAILWNSRAIATIAPKRQFILRFALRLAMQEVSLAQQEKVVDLLFKACWVEQIDMGSEAAVEAYLSQNGIDTTALFAKINQPGIKQLLEGQTSQAIERGVFGVPTMFIEDELFWGVDQIDDIEDFLAGKDSLTKQERELSAHSWGLGHQKDRRPARINGVAHTVLVVANFEKSKPFYEHLCQFLGMQKVYEGNKNLHYVGGQTALAIGESKGDTSRFSQEKVGLHHICFRAKTRRGVDECYRSLQDLGANIIQPPQEGPWAPGYYSMLFEDPDGIRLEINHVPGKGPVEQSHLALCHGSSIEARDLQEIYLNYPHRQGVIHGAYYSKTHKWNYFPAMTTQEAIVVKCFDSNKEVIGHTLHSSITDKTKPSTTSSRQSIEVRVLALF